MHAIGTLSRSQSASPSVSVICMIVEYDSTESIQAEKAGYSKNDCLEIGHFRVTAVSFFWELKVVFFRAQAVFFAAPRDFFYWILAVISVGAEARLNSNRNR